VTVLAALQNNKKAALREAAERAAAEVACIENLADRCANLGLPTPDSDGVLRFDLLKRRVEFRPPDYDGRVVNSDASLHAADRLLVLHYLLCERRLSPSGEWITFRQFPGGQFYWQPFLNRTVVPFVRAIGNDLDLLRNRLNRYEWTSVDRGDLGARVKVFGHAEVTLVYHAGDDEFPAEADILFDSCLRGVFCAEDAAALASRVCLGLCSTACEPCSGCGLWDAGLKE
jgi:hypothetical protein